MITGSNVFTQLQALKTPAQQCEYLLRLGLRVPERPLLRRPEHRIPGCQTALWLTAECKEGIVYWQSDSDSVLVRGILTLFHARYEGRTPEEIRRDPPDFLQQISEEILSPELRRNGLAACYGRIACF